MISLSRREREVATLLAGGASNAEIATALCISSRTVEAHLVHLRTKTSCGTTRRLIAYLAQTAGRPAMRVAA